MLYITLLVYNILLHLGILITFPYYLVKAKRTGVDIRYWFGYLPPGLKEKSRHKQTVWVHAVSVGEVNSVRPLIKAIKTAYPDWSIVLSTITGPGNQFARKMVKEADSIIFFPSDLPWSLHRFYRYIRPQLLLIVETELWPNLISMAASRSIPVVLVNGSISGRSASRYQKIRWLFQPILHQITLFLMQSPAESERIISFGAAKEKVIAPGNIKFDVAIPELEEPKKQRYLSLFGFNTTQPILLVGSTHPGEETIILRVYAELLKQVPELKMILVPRHPHRADEISKEIESMHFAFVWRSQLDKSEIRNPKSEIILVDTVGELTKLYSLATIVFVGGSLVPIGGHNILEPAVLGKPVLFGPYMQETKDSTDLLLNAGGGIQVQSEQELIDTILLLLNQHEERQRLGNNAKSAVITNQGATQRILDLLRKYLG